MRRKGVKVIVNTLLELEKKWSDPTQTMFWRKEHYVLVQKKFISFLNLVLFMKNAIKNGLYYMCSP